MPPQLALLIGAIFVFIAFRSDRKRDFTASGALLWPTLWYLVAASRMPGVWLTIWGIPLPGGGGDATDGSLIDRSFFAGLTVIGMVILSRRQFDWGATLRRNPWLTALITFMALSVIWSAYPYVSFKRYIKVVGSIVMALVVLTEERPLESFLTVLRRCLYIHLPISIICIKYFRNIGVSFDWSGTTEAWQGISTSKNTLGQVAMLGVIYFFWEVRRHWPECKWKNLHVVYLLMALYLLKGSEDALSLTSLSVCVFAVLIFLRIQALKFRPYKIRPFVLTAFYTTVGLSTLILLHSIFMFSEDSPFGYLITKFGRDITLTDRTLIWHDVYGAASGNPLLGVGFGGFWIGRMANIPWNDTMTWVLGQAHDGYIDTYLQTGIIGCFLLAGVIFTALKPMLASMDDNFDLGCFRITLFLTILFVNVTETTLLRGDHHLWLIFMIILWNVPQRQAVPEVHYEETYRNDEQHNGATAQGP